MRKQNINRQVIREASVATGRLLALGGVIAGFSGTPNALGANKSEGASSQKAVETMPMQRSQEAKDPRIIALENKAILAKLNRIKALVESGRPILWTGAIELTPKDPTSKNSRDIFQEYLAPIKIGPNTYEDPDYGVPPGTKALIANFIVDVEKGLIFTYDSDADPTNHYASADFVPRPGNYAGGLWNVVNIARLKQNFNVHFLKHPDSNPTMMPLRVAGGELVPVGNSRLWNWVLPCFEVGPFGSNASNPKVADEFVSQNNLAPTSTPSWWR